jgi:hypothetical protein
LYESPFVQGIRERSVELYRRHTGRRAHGFREPRCGAQAVNDPTLEQIVISARLRHKADSGFLYSVFSREISGELALNKRRDQSCDCFTLLIFALHVSSQPRTGKSP